MLVWLDGRSNIKARPQENFARELMELFTIGVGQFTESDVYAGARVFTGWNLQRTGAARDPPGVSSSSSTPRSTTRTPRRSAFRFTGRRRRFPRARRPTACRTASISSTRSRAIRKRAGVWPASSGFFISEIADRRASSTASRPSNASNYNMAAVVHAVLSSRVRRGKPLRPLLVARRVRRARAQRGGVRRLLR